MLRSSLAAWFRRIALAGAVLGFAFSLTPVLAQPAAEGEAVADDTPEASASDQSLNLGGMVERYPKIKEIIDTLRDGDRKKTLAELNAFADANADLPPGGVILALALSSAKQPPLVHQALDDAIRSNPEDPDALLLLAQGAVQQRRLSETALLLDVAEPLIAAYSANADRKKSMQLRYNRDRALLNEHREEWQQAADYWDAVLAVEDSANVRYRFARSLFRVANRESREKALTELQKAYDTDNKAVPLPFVAVALLYNEIKNPEQTKKWFDAAEKEYPDSAVMHLRFAHWQWNQGDAVEAKRHAEAAAALDDGNIDAKFLLGLIHRYNNEPEKAQEIFVQCQMMRPEAALIRNHLALVRLDIGDATSTTMARQMAADTYKNNQRDPFTLATLGYILFKSGNQKEGFNYLQAVSRTPSLSPDGRFFIASTLVDIGKGGDAKNVLKQILKGKALFAFRGQAERLLGGLD